ncbi:MAG TPA: OPT/YSL family transporter, partial [Candidatus Aminicenantes bacterium]|nr:OPT/YSL family transporter [Candidatus Aminicenantes bacterium]
LQQQRFKFLGTLVAALSVGAVIFLLNSTYGFDPTLKDSLVAPQANAMAALIQPLMNPGAQVPWLLYGVGALVALMVELIGIAPLAFALGMYIPIELNAPLVIGGLIAHLIHKSSKDRELAEKRHDRGILISSGFIAGGAIIGVVAALLRFLEVNLSIGWADQPKGEVIALVMFTLLSVYLYWDSRRAKMEK